jgi:rhomboid protease GluP
MKWIRLARVYVQRFPASTSLLALLTLVFALEIALGGSTNQEVLTRMGALRSDLVHERGELYRLWTATFLHAGPIHFLLNGFALLQLGAIIEYLYGATRLVVFYGIAGLAGAIGSAAFTPAGATSVGASGAILGLAGVLLGLAWWGSGPPRIMNTLRRPLLWSVVATFAIGAICALTVPSIDNAAHLGGFIAGLVMSIGERSPEAPPQRPVRFLAGLLIASALAAAVSVGLDGHRAVATLQPDVALLLRQRLMNEPSDTMAASVGAVQMMAAYRDAGLPEQAREAAMDVVARYEDPESIALLVALSFESDEALALVALSRWQALAPDDPEPLNATAWLMVTALDMSLRDPGAALALSADSLQALEAGAFEDRDERRAAYLDTRAEALLQLGRAREALPVQREAVELATAVGLDQLPEIRERLERIEHATE